MFKVTMISEDVIVKNEVFNDNRSIYTYYSEMYHRFVAYGISAYLSMMVCKAVGVVLEEDYSTELQMPMIIIDQMKMETIQYKCVMLQDSKEGSFYHLLCNQIAKERDYFKWAHWLRGVK